MHPAKSWSELFGFCSFEPMRSVLILSLLILSALILSLACGRTPAISPPAPAETLPPAEAAPQETESVPPTEPAPTATEPAPIAPPTPTETEPVPTVPPTPTDTEIVPAQTLAPARPEPILSGDHERTLVVGGMEREYILHVPPELDPAQPVPLVLAYHGIGLNAREMMRISGLSGQADSDGFLLAYPEGAGTRQSWNGGTCCGEAMLRKVDDVGFSRAMIEDIAEQVNLDRSRVFATGFSNGAIMIYRLACELADQIAAIGPVAAAPATTSCNPGRPVSVIHFHGDADRLNPYEGGQGPAGGEFMSVEEGIGLWLGLDACPSQAQETQTGNIVHRVYRPCERGSEVELYKILGGEHAWPGGEAVSEQVGLPEDEIDATALMWEFFRQHPRP